MDVILFTVKWQCDLVYLDDVVALHWTRWYRFAIDENVGLTLKLKKSFFISDDFDYLENMLCPGTVKAATETSDADQAFKQAPNVAGLHSLLALCNVYRRFVPSFSKIAARQNEKLNMGEPKFFQLDRNKMEVMK